MARLSHITLRLKMRVDFILYYKFVSKFGNMDAIGHLNCIVHHSGGARYVTHLMFRICNTDLLF